MTAFTRNGDGNQNAKLDFKTMEDGKKFLKQNKKKYYHIYLAPSSPPVNLRYQNETSSSVSLYWEPPLEANGEVILYTIYYAHGEKEQGPII